MSARYAWAPPRSRSLGADCVAFWKDAGGSLFDWQELVIEGMLGLDDDDRWVSSEDGIDVARQNGKGVILQAVEAFCAFELGYRVVMHTAHEFATSQEHQLRLEDMIQNAPHLHGRVKDRGGYMHANGRESINLKSGCRIIFKARTKGGGRGYSGDLLVWDEAMVIPEAVVGAQRPMLRASRSAHGPKVIYAGSAVDEDVHEYGVPFARLRERGIANDPRVSWHEWSAPFDHPDQMTQELLAQRWWWPLANPSMEAGLVLEENMVDEIASMAPRTAAVELGGVGAWPRTTGERHAVFSVDQWRQLVDGSSQIRDGLCLAFEVTPDRKRAAIVAAGRRPDGLFHVEVVEHHEGTSWVVHKLVELRRSHRPRAIRYDKVGPAAALERDLEDANLDAEPVTTQEFVQACGRLADHVDQGTVRHLGTKEFETAVRGAATRPLGDAWAWSRRGSTSDVSPLVAATIALFAAESQKGSDGLIVDFSRFAEVA